MRCKGCPRNKFCKGSCEVCDFGKKIKRLNNKIARLEKHNEILRNEILSEYDCEKTRECDEEYKRLIEDAERVENEHRS